jgi:hypothetical protein
MDVKFPATTCSADLSGACAYDETVVLYSNVTSEGGTGPLRMGRPHHAQHSHKATISNGRVQPCSNMHVVNLTQCTK